MNKPQETASAEARGTRKDRVGQVISNKMDKTIVVKVERRVRHAKFEKVLTLSSKFYAHDEKNEANIGDRVRIVETRPLSRLKRWRLAEIVEKNVSKTTRSDESAEAAAAAAAAAGEKK